MNLSTVNQLMSVKEITSRPGETVQIMTEPSVSDIR